MAVVVPPWIAPLDLVLSRTWRGHVEAQHRGLGGRRRGLGEQQQAFGERRQWFRHGSLRSACVEFGVGLRG